MRTLFLFLIFIQVSVWSAYSQDYSADQNKGKKRKQQSTNVQSTKSVSQSVDSGFYTHPTHSIGLASGFTTGYGLSYRYWPSKVGFQFTTFPVVSSQDKNLSIGLIGLCELSSKGWYRIYAFAGGNLNWTENSDYSDYEDETLGPIIYLFNLNAPLEEQKRYTVGFGPGVEFAPGKHFSINLMTGFRYAFTDYAVSKDEQLLTLTADIAMYYRF